MSEQADLYTIISETYSDLIDCEYDPIAIAATLMVAGLSIYAKELTPEAYTEVVNQLLSTSGSFIDTKNRTLH